MRVGPVLAIALIVLTASALWWLETMRRSAPVETAEPTQRHEPEAYFDHFQARAWTTDGAPRHKLDGRRMVRFTDDSSSTIEGPRVLFRDPAAPPWHLVSDRGEIDATGEQIGLLGQVVATRDPTSADMLVIRTASLQVDLARGQARTAAAVDVVTSGSRAHATGLVAHFDRGVVELQHNVRGHYDPAITASD